MRNVPIIAKTSYSANGYTATLEYAIRTMNYHEERVRFHNLLAEIGEEVIVILSTHIVSDVSDLCPNLAIMNKGRVLLTGKPAELTVALRGKLWAASVPRAEVAAARERYAVISTRLYAGQTVIHVVAESSPGPEFSSAEPTLEDVYFATITGHGARA